MLCQLSYQAVNRTFFLLLLTMSRFKWDKIWTWVFPGSAGLLRRELCDGENLTAPPFLSPHSLPPLFLMTMLENKYSREQLGLPECALLSSSHSRQAGRERVVCAMTQNQPWDQCRWCWSQNRSWGQVTLVPHPQRWAVEFAVSRRFCRLRLHSHRWTAVDVRTWGLSPPGGDSKECCYHVTG